MHDCIAIPNSARYNMSLVLAGGSNPFPGALSRLDFVT